MITKEAIEAACAALNKRDRGNAISIPDVVAMLTAAFAAMPGPAVKVKQLEWDHEAVTGFACSRKGALSYSIMLSRNRVYGVIGEHDGAAEFADIEAAKAAAQADYEARILSALTPAPDLASENERLRAAAADVISSASDTYRKRNGHLASFQDESGEKCFIVPFDAFEELRAALERT